MEGRGCLALPEPEDMPVCRRAEVGNPVRVVIVGSESCRQAVRGWLDGAGDILIVEEVTDGQEVLRHLREVHPDIVLVDVSVAPAVWVREMAAHAGIIVLHVAGQEALVLEALRAGALGHLNRQTTRPSQAIAAVRAVRRGEAVLSPILAGRIVDEVAGRHRGKESK